MTVMAFEDVHKLDDSHVIEVRIGYWQSEYPDLDFFVGSVRGRLHIIGSDEPC